MTTNVLEIFALLLAGVAVGGSFMPRFPAVLPAWLGMLCMRFVATGYVNTKTLIFWGLASLIVLALNILQPKALTAARQGHAYVVGATVVGIVLGYLLAPMAAAITLGGIAGAALGAIAYMRTPDSPKFSIASPEFLQYLCAKGLPAVVACSMAAIIIAVAL